MYKATDWTNLNLVQDESSSFFVLLSVYFQCLLDVLKYTSIQLSKLRLGKTQKIPLTWVCTFEFFITIYNTFKSNNNTKA